jgi:PAS domain S-box-containing protein
MAAASSSFSSVGHEAPAMNTNQDPNPEVARGTAIHPPQEWPENPLERALRQVQTSLLRYQELFDFAPDGYLVTDPHAIIQEANHAAAALLGTRKEFLVGKPLVFYVNERDQRAFTANLHRLTQEAESHVQWELTLCPPRAAAVYALVTATTVRNGEQASGVRWTIKDITRRRELEQWLRAEKEFSDSLVEMATAIILVLDGAGRMVRVNSFLCELTGRRRSEVIGRRLADLVIDEDRLSFRQDFGGMAASAPVARGVHRLVAWDGHAATIAWSARILAIEPDGRKQILFIGNDVTELQEVQQRALHAERLATIGQMAAGLAHESRNCLQRSQACLAMLGFRLNDQPEALELVKRAQKAEDDLHRLYEEVREYAAPINLDLSRCRLDEVWRQAWEDLVSAREARAASLAEESEGVDLEVTASPFHLTQVFRNLFENALGAAANRVTVCCTPAEFDGREAVQVEIRDNGTGFAQEEQKRAFEDFFTTKVHGTGLGLAICKRIIEAHGGHIAVGESAEPGAVLLITLPRTSA